jgi:hypothetical protein
MGRQDRLPIPGILYPTPPDIAGNYCGDSPEQHDEHKAAHHELPEFSLLPGTSREQPQIGRNGQTNSLQCCHFSRGLILSRSGLETSVLVFA